MDLSRTEPERSDDSLVAALLRGERTALATLYDRYAALMFGVARRVLGNDREAEDLVHDVFLEMWKRADAYDAARGTVRTWILMRLRSRALDRCKTGWSSRVALVDPTQMSGAAFANEADLSLGADRPHLVRVLGLLTQDQREVIELAYFDGLSSSEIAEQLGIPLGTVKSRTASALQRMRESLNEGRRQNA